MVPSNTEAHYIPPVNEKDTGVISVDENMQFTEKQKKSIEQQYEKNKKKTLEKFESLSSFPEIAEFLNSQIRNTVFQITDHTRVNDTHRTLLIPRSKRQELAIVLEKAEVYDAATFFPEINTSAIFFGQAEEKIMSKGRKPLLTIEKALHEYAHSLCSSEILFDKEQGQKAKVSVERHGFKQNALASADELIPKIGKTLEELHAYCVQSFGITTIAELNRSKDPDFEYHSVYDRRREAARNVLHTLASKSGVSEKKLIKLMTEAKVDPRKNEQRLRTLIEANGRDGLYDLLLTFDFNQTGEQSIVGTFNKLAETIENYSSPTNFIVNEDDTISQ